MSDLFGNPEDRFSRVAAQLWLHDDKERDLGGQCAKNPFDQDNKLEFSWVGIYVMVMFNL